ncbi:MAG: apolipoprotein N-acyltransferase, partial [Calditrichales bacterium]
MRFTNRQVRENKLILKNNPRAKDLRDVLITVVLFVLSYAPSPFGFLIYLAFIPQLHLYTRHKWPMAFLYGYLIGLLVNLITLYWIFFYADYGFAIIVTGNALQFAFFGGMLSFLHGKNEKLAWFAFPFLWTFLEYARQLGDLAFNWLNIAYTQSYYLYLLQYVEYTGYLGVVFWICLVNITLYYVIKTRYRVSAMVRGTLIIMILFLLPLAVGILKLNETPSAQGISVAYVQPNIDPVVKWERDFLHENLSMLLRLTDSVMVTQPDLVVWPETAVPYDLRSANDNLNLITDHVQRYRYHLLSGAMDQDAAGRYNAAYFFSPADTQFTVYRKLLLVPGAESLAYFPDWMGIDQSGYLKAGKDPVGFTYSGLLYGLYFNGEDWQVS